jgi:hypothetical protein
MAKCDLIRSDDFKHRIAAIFSHTKYFSEMNRRYLGQFLNVSNMISAKSPDKTHSRLGKATNGPLRNWLTQKPREKPI